MALRCTFIVYATRRRPPLCPPRLRRHGLLRACTEAVRILKQSQPEAGGAGGAGAGPTGSGGPALSTGGGIEVSSGTGGGSHSKKGPKEPEAKLDFFGAEVRAQVRVG